MKHLSWSVIITDSSIVHFWMLSVNISTDCSIRQTVILLIFTPGLFWIREMNTIVNSFWRSKKTKLKKKFKNLTDKDLSYTEGKETEMIEMLGSKLGKTKKELLWLIITLWLGNGTMAYWRNCTVAQRRGFRKLQHSRHFRQSPFYLPRFTFIDIPV